MSKSWETILEILARYLLFLFINWQGWSEIGALQGLETVASEEAKVPRGKASTMGTGGPDTVGRGQMGRQQQTNALQGLVPISTFFSPFWSFPLS